MDTEMEMDTEMTDAGQDTSSPGHPAIRPPPGFEHYLAPTVTFNNQSLGSEDQDMTSVPDLVPDRGEDDMTGEQFDNHEIAPLRINKVRPEQTRMGPDNNSEPQEPSGSSSTPRATQNSSSSQVSEPSPESGIFPFPPPIKDEDAKMPDSSASSSVVTVYRDAKFEVKQRPSAPSPVRSHIAPTHSKLGVHHHLQIMDTMRQKAKDLQEYQKTENFEIMHMDWIAGNPNDPAVGGGVDRGDPGEMVSRLSDEDQVLQMQIADIVTSFVNQVQGPQRDNDWSKTMFFGNWLQNKNGENAYFVEIQLKRISGSDDDLLKECGVNPRYVWLALQDASEPVNAITCPTQVYTDKSPPARNSIPSRATGDENCPAEDAFHSTSTAQTVLQLPPPHRPASPKRNLTSIIQSARGVRMHSLNAMVSSTVDNLPIDPRLGTTDPVKQEPASEPSYVLATIPDAKDSKDMDTNSEASTELGEIPPSGIPRSHPLPHSTSLTSTTTNCSIESEESKSHVPTKPSRGIRETQAWQKTLTLHREGTIDKILNDPDFPSRRSKSFVYVVRVLAVPEAVPVSNVFTGPTGNDRKASLLGSGGWVVPPLEERIKWHNDRKAHQNTDPGQMTLFQSATDDNNNCPTPTKTQNPQVCRAAPVRFDWTNNIAPRYYGETAPVWRLPVDPCLEDVYWLVWQLLSGRQYIGFRPGQGFGSMRYDTKGDVELLGRCPFVSPSPEAKRCSDGGL